MELVNILTIFELTGGNLARLPANIVSTVFSSILMATELKIQTSRKLDSEKLVHNTGRVIIRIQYQVPNCWIQWIPTVEKLAKN